MRPAMEDYDEDGYPYTGPTTLEDAWYTHHVVSLGYPRVKLPKVIPGQTTVMDFTIFPSSAFRLHSPGIWQFSWHIGEREGERIVMFDKAGWWSSQSGEWVWLGDGEKPDGEKIG